jgi:hypothetical protein
MEQATEEDTRVTHDRVRDTVRELRAALAAIGVTPAVLRMIVPTEDITGVRLIRAGTWDLASVVALTAALAPHRPPLIGRADLPPILPPSA